MPGKNLTRAEAAQRAGAGMVRLATPGGGHGPDVPREVVTIDAGASIADAVADHHRVMAPKPRAANPAPPG